MKQDFKVTQSKSNEAVTQSKSKEAELALICN